MSIKRIILHAGIHKTGSSSIQDTLFYNSAILQNCNYIYVREWGSNQSAVVFNLFEPIPFCYHFNISSGIQTPAALQDYNKIHLKALINAVSSSNCETLIISAEDMCLLSEDGLIALKIFMEEHFENAVIDIVMYVRNPAGIAVSLYQQWYFTPENHDSAQDHMEIIMDSLYYRRINKFFAIFGEARVSVYSYEDAVKHDGGLVVHFLDNIGVSPDCINRLNILKSNASRCMEAIDFMSYVESEIPYFLETTDQVIVNPLRSPGDVLCLDAIQGTRFDLPLEIKQNYLLLNEKDAHWLKTKTGIDYCNVQPTSSYRNSEFSYATLQDFYNIFNNLTNSLKKAFLGFFEELYNQTDDHKFCLLFAPDSPLQNTYAFADNFEKQLGDGSAFQKHPFIQYNNINSSMISDYGQLYVNNGSNGFSDDRSHRVNKDRTGTIVFNLHFDESEHIRKIRIDPSLYPCVILVKKLIINNKIENFSLAGGNYYNQFGSFFAFYLDDPQIYLNLNEDLTSIEFEMLIDYGSYPFIYSLKHCLPKKENLENARINSILEKDCHLLKQQKTIENSLQKNEYLQSLLAEKDSALINMQAYLTEKDKLIHQLHAIISDRDSIIKEYSDTMLKIMNVTHIT